MEKVKCFKNAKEFNQLFPVREFNGKKTRQNGILLALLKSKEVWNFCKSKKDWRLLSVKSLQEMFNLVIDLLEQDRKDSHSYPNYFLRLLGRTFKHPQYFTDANYGLCTRGGMIRYCDAKSHDNVYEMRAGKMMASIISHNSFGKILPEQVKNYVCEIFSEKWTASAEAENDYDLFVGEKLEDFDRIYDSERQYGCFHSCMNGKSYYEFYRYCVDAKAAYLCLRDQDDVIFARCVLLKCKTVDDDREFWVAERQYSENDKLKRILVNKLYKGGYISYNKAVGAGCGDTHSFEDENGNVFGNNMYIDVCTSSIEEVPYMDTFKWLDFQGRKAYNDESCDYDYVLDRTDGELEDPKDCLVYNDGEEVWVTENERDDYYIFVEDLDEYHHRLDVEYCEDCGRELVPDRGDSCYSDFSEQWFCCEECMRHELYRIIENAVERDNWEDLEYWYHDEEIYVFYENEGRYNIINVNSDVFNILVDNDMLLKCGDKYFNMLDCDGNPIVPVEE